MTPNTLSKPLILLTIILMDLLTGTEFDLFVPSFPEIESHFNLTPFWVEALLSFNFAGYCLSLFLVGTLADRYGRKPILLLGLLIFTLGSILCLWTPSYPQLLAGRFLQGVGVAAPSILSFLIIADAYSLKKQQYFYSMLNGVMNTSVALAPVVGSYVTLYFHWQGNFIALLILGLITLIMTLLFTPNYTLAPQKETHWLRGYFQLFKSKPLMLLMINIILMFVPYWIFVGISPLLYMKDLGVNLEHFGFYQGALALTFALGSVVFGLVMHKFKQRTLLNFSGCLYVISLISVGLVTAVNSKNALMITLGFIPFIISQIIPSNMLIPICLNYIPEAKARVSAVLQGARLIFAALGLQVAGWFYTGSFTSVGMIIGGFIVMVIITQAWVVRAKGILKGVS